MKSIEKETEAQTKEIMEETISVVRGTAIDLTIVGIKRDKTIEDTPEMTKGTLRMTEDTPETIANLMAEIKTILSRI